MEPTFIALVGDHDPDVVAHRAVPKSLGLATLSLGRPVDAVWVGTERVAEDEEEALGHVDAVWLVPASPYRSMEGALAAVRRARERGMPFLGTCGGFQHAVIEFARNVCGIADADHAETSPHASALLVAPLACALRGGRPRAPGRGDEDPRRVRQRVDRRRVHVRLRPEPRVPRRAGAKRDAPHRLGR
ncbi:MAG TPA: hypothetical protein VGB15_24240 [Longimicrobium sp.]|jgi:CTP synthase (UTP-ammonia lyase)